MSLLPFSHLPSYSSPIRSKNIYIFLHFSVQNNLPSSIPQYLDSLEVTKVQNSDITIVEALVKFLDKDQLILHFQYGVMGGMGGSIYIIGKQIS